MKRGTVKHLFPGSNTPEGFYSFYHQGLAGMEQLFILKGGPGTGKSTLIRKLAADMVERGYDVELWQCSSDNDSLDGVVVPALKLAVIDGTAPHVVDPVCPGAVDEIINLGEHWDRDYLRQHKGEIQEINRVTAGYFATAYGFLAKVKEDMLELEKKMPSLPMEELARQGDQLVEEIFRSNLPEVRHFFATAVTPRGWLGFVDELTAGCRHRYILQGRFSAISLVLAQVAKVVIDKGHAIDIFYRAFAPNEMEMLVLPGLGVALIAEGIPGVEVKPQDTLIALAGGCQEEALWQQSLTAACQALSQAKDLHSRLETFYVHAMDFEGVDATTRELFDRILAFTALHEKAETQA